jgi:hypothetical protein
MNLHRVHMNDINGPIPHSPELAMNAEGTEGAPTGLNANRGTNYGNVDARCAGFVLVERVSSRTTKIDQ